MAIERSSGSAPGHDGDRSREAVTALTVDHLDALLSGSQLGVLTAASTFTGALEGWIERLLAERGPIPLIPPDEVSVRFGPHAHACTVGLVGSLAALYELPLRGDEPVLAVRQLEHLLGTRMEAVAPLNASGINAFLAVAAACLLELPLIDVDGQGQVLPLIDQSTYALGGLNPAPLVGVGPWADIVTVQSPLRRGEPVERSALTGAGGWLLTALYPAPAVALAAAGIPGSVSRCLAAGATLRSGRGQLAPRLAQQLGGRMIGRGRVLEISQHAEPGAPKDQPAGPVSIRLAKSGSAGAEITLEVRNEAVLALVDGTIAGSAPDVICLLDPLRGRTVDLLDLQEGDTVDVLLLPAHERWHTPAGIARAGPGAFGLKVPYRGGLR
ncbi:hypothetical protein N864_02730 [Intrasporangium chromatireducens Q5-1]|uniref:DUF917 domain-containing protein n=1 Tax=Intrasporangium chromatireducens Q5-1 TaxID=584657 RepID=W9GKU2_9MICO|nr:DUF917 domain-containing protein [Intrasporangium chromatireducens]EWT05742.1 hypothetical protein N864_02730 [Intrasporangium chromatireducens Q5-1]